MDMGAEAFQACGVPHGWSTLERLILADRRKVCLAEVFFKIQKDRLREVVPAGECVSLNPIGTHSRGSLFLDACHERTAEREAAVDAASRTFEGFYFGRFDIRRKP